MLCYASYNYTTDDDDNDIEFPLIVNMYYIISIKKTNL